VLVLLPPSEGKAAPEAGPAVDLASLSAPELTEHRKAVLDALASASARPDALDVLHVGASLAPEVERNARLLISPTAAAAHVYAGVLYAAADLGGALDASASDAGLAARLDDVRVVSALWGAVVPTDAIPAYRLSMGVDLPGVGSLARSWREPLAKALDARASGDVVVDCRSAPYAAAWKPPAAADHVPVVVLREHAGRRAVVSHHAKHTRGVLVGHLLRRPGQAPRTADELAQAARELLGTARDERRIVDVSLDRAGRRRSLEIVVVDVRA
jgi:hypothetical protein